MRTIYITEQGSVVKKTSRRLIITKGKETIAEIPAINLDRLLIFGNVQVTSQAVAFLLDSGIDLCYLSHRGKFRGRLAPAESKNILLRIAQYERYLDDEFQRGHARLLVEAKIKNARALIKRYARNYPESDFSAQLEGLEQSLMRLKDNLPVSSLLGIEGQATATYFRAFGRMFRGELAFSTRSRRPPRDPVNALLSFGYTLITSEILSLLFAIGFDPYIGYLHGIDYGRPSLALDMVEEFRHPIVDRFTLFLLNNRVLSPEDFKEADDGGFLLKPESLKQYFTQYEKRMNELFQDSFTGEKISFRTLFQRQAHRLARTIRSRELYTPFLLE
ncbi:MAG: CRISPR-associated endonuclease Cas1 [Nitrospinae bacterium RIFCSPLOWO2_12_FULL_45_22]|nr:MAG: CRISPR-associated endonuclease Cas1 [Nitrospinae bacterium RIFCSPLOWO2_12_FULL_45_22]